MKDTRHTDNSFFNTAFRIGATLAREAIWDVDQCDWISYKIKSSHGRENLVKSKLGTDVYSGKAGLLLFLISLYQTRHDPILLKTIEGTGNAIVKSKKLPENDFSFFKGKLGVAIVLIYVGYRLDKLSWVEYSFEIIKRLTNKKSNLSQLDFLNGSSGSLPHLIDMVTEGSGGLGRAEYNQAVTDLITKIGNHLFVSLQSVEDLPILEQPFGLAHGSAGMGMSLIKLGQFFKDDRFVALGHEMFKVAKPINLPIYKSWKDSKDQEEIWKHPVYDVYTMSWSQGLAGIASCRLEAFSLSGLPKYKEKAQDMLALLQILASRSMYSRDATANFSISIGLAGVGRTMLKASKILDDPQYLKTAQNIGVYGQQHIEDMGFDWPGGLIANNVSPGKPALGLIEGMAGTGLFYLELHNKNLPQYLL